MRYDNNIAKRDNVNISYDYYRVFYYIAKYGNITKAAKLLINNQPNLTRIIKNLENSLGCPLFTRNNRGMKLTPEGEKLYRHISAAFEHIEAAEEEISESRSLNGGSVYIAASPVKKPVPKANAAKRPNASFLPFFLIILSITKNTAVSSITHIAASKQSAIKIVPF